MLRGTQTCRRLQDTIRGSSELQYIIMLSAFGMCDGASAHIPAEERLRKLGAHQSAWRDGKFTEAATMALSDSIEVSGNVIVSISRDTRRRLLVHQVPSPLRGIAAREWEVNLPFDVFHFLVDAAQDLLLVLEGAFSSCVASSPLSGLLTKADASPEAMHVSTASTCRPASRTVMLSERAPVNSYISTPRCLVEAGKFKAIMSESLSRPHRT